MKKFIAIMLLTTVLLSIVSINAFAVNSSDAGIRILQKSEENGIVTFAVQMKLPENSQGVTTISTILCYDSTDLELKSASGDSTYTADGLTADISAAIDLAVQDDTSTDYMIFDAKAFASADKTAIAVNLMTFEAPNAAQNTTEWQDVYLLSFNVKENATVTANSIRFAKSTDSDVLTELEKTNIPVEWAAIYALQSDGASYHYNALDGQSTALLNIMSATGTGQTQLIQEYQIGDIDKDGSISLFDALYISRYRLDPDKNPLTDEQLILADIDKDGTVTLYDALYISQYRLDPEKNPLP